jgi:hypothetical protein
MRKLEKRNSSKQDKLEIFGILNYVIRKYVDYSLTISAWFVRKTLKKK